MDTPGFINRIVVAFLSFIAMVVAVIYGSNYTTRFYLADIAERGQGTLRLSVAGLQGVLSRFEYLPGLLAKDRFIGQYLLQPDDPALAMQVNDDLKRVAGETGADAIFVMDAAGSVIAASNHDTNQSFISRTFFHKPFFQGAIKGAIGHYFALTAPDGNRGYFYAAPIYFENTVIGALAVKVDVDNIETAWASPAHEILVTDDKSIIFMASRADWRFKSLRPITEATRRAIADTGQYAGTPIGQLKVMFDPAPASVHYRSLIGADAEMISVSGAEGSSQFLVQKMTMPDMGWTVHILSNTGSARTQAAIFTIIAALLMLILVMFLVFLWQRRARLVERIALQRDAQDMLERRVEERTASLNRANRRLVSEISEREAAEQELRKTQEDLIQAGKLAALGQMSTALSHEFNQPLAAIRSYADNADILMERDRIAEARDNVQHISALTDRMASISKHLRNFARKPGEKMGAVSLKDVVRDTLELLAGKIKSADVELLVDLGEEDVLVEAGHVRLQQVLVNLTANAIDAMRDVARPRLEIRSAASAQPGRRQISVRDVGPGVSDEVIARVFDPFFTTKDVGQGLGLGLSISFNIIKDFGGMLRVANHADGGALFTVELKEADPGLARDETWKSDGAWGADDHLETGEGIAAE